MRVRNKEIRQRRHRKEQKMKEALREIRATQGEKKATAPAKPKAAAKKPARKTEA
jgi:hypothetical protein